MDDHARRQVTWLCLWAALVVAAAGVAILQGFGVPAARAERGSQAAVDIIPNSVRVTNVTGQQFTVSWLTTEAVTGAVRYGTLPGALAMVANDDMPGPRTTHHVTLGSFGFELLPSTWYYYDILSGAGGAGGTDDNGGVHFVFVNGPELGVPPPVSAIGMVVTTAGAPVSGSLVYFALRDADGMGSPGWSAPWSAISEGPYWWLPVSSMRSWDLGDYFSYISAMDRLEASVQGDPDGWAVESFAPAQAIEPLSRTITLTTGMLPPPPAPAPLAGSQGPDLMVESIVASVDGPGNMCAATFTVTVRNAGNQTASAPFRVALYVDHSREPYPGEPSNINAYWVVEQSLGKNDAVVLSSSGFAPGSGRVGGLPAAGTHRVRAQADSFANAVAELAETNNVSAPYPVTVGGGCLRSLYLPLVAKF